MKITDNYQNKLEEYIKEKYGNSDVYLKKSFENELVSVWACENNLELGNSNLPFEYGFYLKSSRIKYDMDREGLLVFENYQNKFEGFPWFSFVSETDYATGLTTERFKPLWEEYENALSKEDKHRLEGDNLFREVYTLLKSLEPWGFTIVG